MEIAWFGSACFRLRDRNTIAVTDPYLLDPSFQNLQTKADVTTLSRGDQKLRKLVPPPASLSTSSAAPANTKSAGSSSAECPSIVPIPS